MDGLLKVSTTLWTTLLIASVTSALWPAFPSKMGASAGKYDKPEVASGWGARNIGQSSQKRRLLDAGFNDGNDACRCSSEFLSVDGRARENGEKLEALEDEVNGLYAKLNSLKSTLTSVDREGKRSPSPQTYNIAFSARVGYNRPYLSETEVIVFDELVINNGDVYDPYSGKFTSPVPGLYHFETTILSGFNATIETMIVLNGNEVGRVFSGGFNNRGSGSNSLLLNMDQGDEVWISVFFGNGDYVHGLWSTFSGYLVHSYNNL